MKKYNFSYYGWIPGYNDFDQDGITIEATSEEEAWKEFNKSVKFVKSACIESVEEVTA